MIVDLFNNVVDYKYVKISTAWMRHKFMCSEHYILNKCNGRCCEGGNHKTLITLLPFEVEREKCMSGVVVSNGRIVADPKTKKCPHKLSNGFCALHTQGLKPLGCIFSPFTLNRNDTLIVRKRYLTMNCHRKPDSNEGQPAYITFRKSLDTIFGYNEAERICNNLKVDNSKFIYGKMPLFIYAALHYLDDLKKDGYTEGMLKHEK